MLAVDGQFIPGTGVRFADGDLRTGGGGSKLSDDIANALDAPTADGASPTPSAGPYLVSEWLELTVTQPNGKSDTSRRVLFDRANTAWHASAEHDAAKLAPMEFDAERPVVTQSVFEICVTAGHHDLRSYDAEIAAFLEANAQTGGVEPASAATLAPDEKPDFFATMRPFWLRNMLVAMISDERIIPALNDRPGLRFYADSPRISIFSAEADPQSGNTLLTTDLRRDTLRAVAQDPSGASMAADGILAYGVMEGSLETELAEPPRELQVAGAPLQSTSNLLGPDGVAVLHPGDDLSTITDPETAERVRSALGHGASLVVPRQVLHGGPSGWWEIAADHSSVRAVCDDDLGMANGPIRIKPGGFSNPGKYSKISPERPPPRPTFEFQPRRGGMEYSLLTVIAIIVIATIVVGCSILLITNFTRKVQPALEP